jgi:hypothetical protein
MVITTQYKHRRPRKTGRRHCHLVKGPMAKTNYSWSRRDVAQRVLNAYYTRSLADPVNFREAPDDLQELSAIRELEEAWNAEEEARVAHEKIPENEQDFIGWYNGIYRRHTDEVRPFFDYLATRAPLKELAFYICLEEEVDGHFDDVIALSQLGVADLSKLTIAENYWDELGRGVPADIHTAMFAESADYMKAALLKAHIRLPAIIPVEALKNANILLMYALRRRYTPRLLGAIGILEHTASERFAATVRGLRRVNAPEKVVRYHEAHIDFDANHGAEWLHNVLLPMIKKNREVALEIALGILIRYRIAIDYYAAIQASIRKMRRNK